MCLVQLLFVAVILQLINNQMFQIFCFSQYDPFAEHRPQKIADREDEYKARRMQMIISPERLDPFVDGKI